jgi:hypothetical protein
MRTISLLTALLCCAPITYAHSFDTDYALSFGGFYGYTDYKHQKNSFHKNNNLNSTLNAYGKISHKFNDSYEASLVGYFMIDSAKEIENYNQGYWGEEVFALLESPYGEISIGQDYNVAYNFAVGAPNIGTYRVNNSDILNFITSPNWYKKDKTSSYKTLNSTYINTDGASPKINYITPSYKGIKLGATYVPKTYSQSGLVSKYAPYKNESAYILGAYSSWYALGVEIETSLGFAEFAKNDKEYSLGISLYRKGWTLGASYRKTDSNDSHYKLNQANLYDGYRDAKAYNIGLSYEIGPLTTGVSYFDSKSDKFNNRDKIFSFSNSYQYNKQTSLSLTFSRLDSSSETKTKGYAVILGMELSI